MGEKIIELRNANIYQGNSLILQDVNISVNRGEFVYLVGKTGTGKSSLLKTLYGELPLKEGEGTVGGFDIKALTWKTVPFLRRTIGIVFQDFQLLSDRNVHDNLDFVLQATGWKDKKLIEVARKGAKKGHNLHICSMELLLDGILRQKIDPNKHSIKH